MFITTVGGGMLASSLVGGLLGGSESGSDSSQSRQLDPRLSNYVFGSDGKPGLLSDASNLYSQQMATGGLNNYQRQGLDMQMQYLNSPQYQQGNQQLFNMGSSLLGGGIASNPYTSGARQLPSSVGRMQQLQSTQVRPTEQRPATQQMQGFQYQPYQNLAPDYSVKAPVAQPVTQSDFDKWMQEYLAKQTSSSDQFGD